MNGVVMVVHGKKWNSSVDMTEEAKRCLESLRKYSPDLHVTCYTDDPIAMVDQGLNRIESIEPIVQPWVWKRMQNVNKPMQRFRALCLAKLAAINRAGYSKTLWADADIVFLKPFEEIFEIDADVGLIQENLKFRPAAGFMAFLTARGHKLAQAWEEQWYRFKGANDDQQLLDHAIRKAPPMKLALLPWWKWNVRPRQLEEWPLTQEEKQEAIIMHSRFHTPEQFYA